MGYLLSTLSLYQVRERLLTICQEVSDDSPIANLNNCSMASLGNLFEIYDTFITRNSSLADIASCPDAQAYYESITPFLNSCVVLSLTICFTRIVIKTLTSIFAEI